VIDYLAKRPIAVFMSLAGIVVISLVLLSKIPVSLMPQGEVPRLIVEVPLPGYSPGFIEKSALQQLRAKFQGLTGLVSQESIASNGIGQIELNFEFGTDMKLAYILANEKIDQVIDQLPSQLDRPVIRKVSSSDLPVSRIHISSSTLSLLELSEFARFIVQRRLEQLPGVSLVETNGLVRKVFRISPRYDIMNSMGITTSSISDFIKRSNFNLSQIKVTEGLYEYDVVFENNLNTVNAIKNLNFPIDATKSIPFERLADINESFEKRNGLHMLDEKEGVVFAVHKQNNASFFEVDDHLKKAIEELKIEFPEVTFANTQNQREILQESIQQLIISILLGVILASLILFLVEKNWKSSLIMSLLIPISLLASVFPVYFLGEDFNVVTLSGVLLAIGILIDNGIILIDNINAKRSSNNILESASKGLNEIFPALISSTLTTMAVFIPLLLIGGVAGQLFRSQLIVLGILLFTSLLVSYIFIPVIYVMLNPKDHNISPVTVMNLYRKSKKRFSGKIWMAFFIIVTLLGIFSFFKLPKSNLPDLERSDSRIVVEWRNNLTLTGMQNQLLKAIDQLEGVTTWEMDLGINSIYEPGINHVNKALIYINFRSYEEKTAGEQKLTEILSASDEIIYSVSNAKNPYDQLFDTEDYFAVFKLRSSSGESINQNQIRQRIDQPDILEGYGFAEAAGIALELDENRMKLFEIGPGQIIEQLKVFFDKEEVTRLAKVNESIPIMLQGDPASKKQTLNDIYIIKSDSTQYPILQFIDFKETTVNRFVAADQIGVYQDLLLVNEVKDFETVYDGLLRNLKDLNLTINLGGEVTQIKKNQESLLFSIFLAVLVLFLILTAQFESFLMPLVILSEIPIAIAGSLLGLWLVGEDLSISSLIGIVITLGIIVNDSILKVDTARRHIKSGFSAAKAIDKAGEERLKPILMTSVTTILALSPVLFSSGIGADIQLPLAVAVISGLIIGTLCSIYLLPILFKLLIVTNKEKLKM